MYVSSDSTILPPLPSFFGKSSPLSIALRILWQRNQAVRYWQPIARLIWFALMPFFDSHIRATTKSHLVNGRCVSSKMVPTVTENWYRQVLHSKIPRSSPLLLRTGRRLTAEDSQRKQVTPLVQRSFSRYSLHWSFV